MKSRMGPIAATTVAVSSPASHQTMKLRRLTGRTTTFPPECSWTSLAMAAGPPSELVCSAEIYHRLQAELGPAPRPQGLALAGLQEVPADGAPPARPAMGAGSRT